MIGWFSGFIFAAYMRKFQDREEEKEFDIGSDEPEVSLPSTVTSRVRYCTEIFHRDKQSYYNDGFPEKKMGHYMGLGI